MKKFGKIRTHAHEKHEQAYGNRKLQNTATQEISRNARNEQFVQYSAACNDENRSKKNR